MSDARELRKILMLFEEDLARLHERIMTLLGVVVEAQYELESRVRALEEDTVKKAIAFEAKKAGVSEEQFLSMVADYIRRKLSLEKEEGLE